MLFPKLYDYQDLMLSRIATELAKPDGRKAPGRFGRKERRARSVMVQMPTGTGKTYVMAAVIKRTKVAGEVWVIAHRRELVEQMEQTLDKFGMAYVEAKSVEEWKRADIRVMSIQWLAKNIGETKTSPALIIIDEAHHAMAASYRMLWTIYPDAQRIGFTATPCRMKAADFTKQFDVLLQSYTVREFIERGRLSLYDYVVTNRNSADQHTIDSFEKRGTDGDYSVSEMAAKLNVEQTIGRLYQSVRKYAYGKKGIVYAIDRRHAKNIAEYYTAHGLRAVAIDSRTPAAQRTKIVADFKEGRLDCLVNVNLFDEGFDCPDVEYIQMARPTLSLAKYLQMVGRGLRVHPDKTMCVLIDNVGLYRMFGLPDAERNWDRMFEGFAAGKGSIDRLRRVAQGIAVNNSMEIVANHSSMMPKTDEEKRVFEEQTVPYQSDGRWGLKSGNEIVLSAIYAKIDPFVGCYCAYSIADGRWGVLTRRGRVIVSPEYKRVNVLPDGTATVSVNDFFEQTINLVQAEQEERENREWRKRFSEKLEKHRYEYRKKKKKTN